jgi:hypothetical protein
MGRVADELDAVATPIFSHRTGEQAPFRTLRHRTQQGLEARLGVRKAYAHFVGIAGNGPALFDPLVGILLGHNIHDIAAAQIINIEMAPGPQPLDMARRFEHVGGHVAAQ